MTRAQGSAVARRRQAVATWCIVATLPFATAAWAADEASTARATPTAPDTPAAAAPYRIVHPDDVVTFHGIANFDAAGLGDGPMMYPGGAGPAGLVVGVIVHAVIADARRKHQKTALQERADEVLAPYADGLANWSQRDLFDRGVDRVATPGRRSGDGIRSADGSGDEWVVESAPTFAMNQDSRAIVLDNVVTISHAGDTPYRNTIRVVSSPLDAEAPEPFWAANDLANLKAESAGLLAMSLDIALSEARRSGVPHEPIPQRTLRYRVGGQERMERAELVGESCDRLLMRTLRGWIMSAPAARRTRVSVDGKGCDAATVAGS